MDGSATFWKNGNYVCGEFGVGSFVVSGGFWLYRDVNDLLAELI